MSNSKTEVISKSVILAIAGIKKLVALLGSRLRGRDKLITIRGYPNL